MNIYHTFYDTQIIIYIILWNYIEILSQSLTSAWHSLTYYFFAMQWRIIIHISYAVSTILQYVVLDCARVIAITLWKQLEQISYDCEKVTVRMCCAVPWPWQCRVLAFWLDVKCSRAIWLVEKISSMPCRDRAVCREFSHSYEICSKQCRYHMVHS
jgi:hypothetical protein